ncbi:unnamed protein product [Boreogadus saida]
MPCCQRGNREHHGNSSAGLTQDTHRAARAHGSSTTGLDHRPRPALTHRRHPSVTHSARRAACTHSFALTPRPSSGPAITPAPSRATQAVLRRRLASCPVLLRSRQMLQRVVRRVAADHDFLSALLRAGADASLRARRSVALPELTAASARTPVGQM